MRDDNGHGTTRKNMNNMTGCRVRFRTGSGAGVHPTMK